MKLCSAIIRSIPMHTCPLVLTRPVRRSSHTDDNHATRMMLILSERSSSNCLRIPDVVVKPGDLASGKHTFRGTSNYPIYVVKVEQNSCLSVTCGPYSAHVVGSFLAGSNSVWVLDDVLAPLPSATEWIPPPSLPNGPADVADLSWAVEAFRRTALDPLMLEGTCFVPNTGALAKYAAVDPTASGSLSSPAGVSSIKAHIIPGPAKSFADFPDGNSTYTSLAGTQIIVQKSGMHMNVKSSTMGLCAAVTGGVGHGRLQLFTISSILAPVTPDPLSLPPPADTVTETSI
ncbi:hypothetical protein DUNSADRAFT_17030 [Dunaliella salina]|uniref:FAS1 domain-containing protein n=1 Tax=Dunaliella salina TaxID=3046 RepID=A0ABQ7H0F9_DUNSA|nr:hypothetical protein DUNSADRAFT_17030 [Dunaliella salina]|eukprot:KAF5840334.1 hypothetical protein DUNSADRAFT_17030 [Dunaliella salina]